ncbi:MAG: glycosyltransferase [Chloroflexi bacterium]|nr:glycosyltransferase [Chloroflexota bacterium]
MAAPRKTVSVVMTVKNDAEGCAVSLDALMAQTRRPDEIVVVDGGSTDDTIRMIEERALLHPHLRLVRAPGVNIARGRNIGVETAIGEIIATTDAGCRAEPPWLERLVCAFEQDPGVELAAGFYRIDPRSLLEEVVGLATMRGQLDPVDPDRFNPSARSLACTKALWRRVGGWPEWLGFSEDTLFDHKVRRLGAGWCFVEDAVVHWRPRRSLRSIARQFFNYGTGRGQTRIGSADAAYNIRNAVLVLITCCACSCLSARLDESAASLAWVTATPICSRKPTAMPLPSGFDGQAATRWPTCGKTDAGTTSEYAIGPGVLGSGSGTGSTLIAKRL